MAIIQVCSIMFITLCLVTGKSYIEQFFFSGKLCHETLISFRTNLHSHRLNNLEKRIFQKLRELTI